MAGVLSVSVITMTGSISGRILK